ncbi:hypothetical protein EXE24_03410 [Acinetobacter johnsonii]|nr:hypothetical protein EXE24_03410 [Acinetobacter johnsonii]
MKNKLFNLANMSKYGYINRALSKISKLALTGYKSQQAYCPKGLFLCVKSLCVRISMVKLERDTFMCAGHLLSLSVNPFQLCHQLFDSNRQSSFSSTGAHSHA